MSELVIKEYRGIRNLVAAEVISDTRQGIEFGEVFAVGGVSELTKSTATNKETKYYDNQAAFNTNSTSADEIGVAASAIEEKVLSKITGYYYDEETEMLVESGDREVKQFAIGYITKKTSGEEFCVWRLKGDFNIPSSTHGTENDGTDSSGAEITYTGLDTVHKFVKTGKRARSVSIPLSKVDETTFFASVQTPDTLDELLKIKA